jgi:hypothetical protein
VQSQTRSQVVEDMDAKRPKIEIKEHRPRGPGACTTCRQAKVRVPRIEDKTKNIIMLRLLQAIES